MTSYVFLFKMFLVLRAFQFAIYMFNNDNDEDIDDDGDYDDVKSIN